MFYAVVIVLAVVAMASYVAGVKRSQKWGTPVLVLCVLALVATVGARMAGVSLKRDYKPTLPAAKDERARAEVVGNAIADQAPDGCRICILTSYDPNSVLKTAEPEWKAGLDAALGDKIAELWTAFIPPMVDGTQLAGAVGDADVVICMYTFQDWPGMAEAVGDLLVAACWSPKYGGGARVDKATVERYFAKGILDVAVVSDGTADTVYRAAGSAEPE